MDVEIDRQRYRVDRAKDLRLSTVEGIDAAMKTHKLDALLFPFLAGACLAARAGYPTIVVPAGFLPNPSADSLPQGFEPRPGPVGVSFTGMACSEPRLIALAYAFEQASKRRVAPRF